MPSRVRTSSRFSARSDGSDGSGAGEAVAGEGAAAGAATSAAVAQPHQALVPGLLELGDRLARLHEVREGAVAERLLAERRIHAPHVGLHRRAVQPLRVVVLVAAEPEGPF